MTGQITDDEWRAHFDAAIAMTTAYLDGVDQKRDKLDVLAAAFAAEGELDPRLLGSAFANITMLAVHRVAAAEGRPVGEVWQEMVAALSVLRGRD